MRLHTIYIRNLSTPLDSQSLAEMIYAHFIEGKKEYMVLDAWNKNETKHFIYCTLRLTKAQLGSTFIVEIEIYKNQIGNRDDKVVITELYQSVEDINAFTESVATRVIKEMSNVIRHTHHIIEPFKVAFSDLYNNKSYIASVEINCYSDYDTIDIHGSWKGQTHYCLKNNTLYPKFIFEPINALLKLFNGDNTNHQCMRTALWRYLQFKKEQFADISKQYNEMTRLVMN